MIQRGVSLNGISSTSSNRCEGRRRRQVQDRSALVEHGAPRVLLRSIHRDGRGSRDRLQYRHHSRCGRSGRRLCQRGFRLRQVSQQLHSGRRVPCRADHHHPDGCRALHRRRHARAGRSLHPQGLVGSRPEPLGLGLHREPDRLPGMGVHHGLRSVHLCQRDRHDHGKRLRRQGRPDRHREGELLRRCRDVVRVPQGYRL